MSKPYLKNYVNSAALEWWENMTPEQRAETKKKWEAYRLVNLASKHPFPNMYSTLQLRVRELGDKQITRIWVFKDRI